MINHLQIQNALRLKILSLSTVSTTAFARATTATYTNVNGVVTSAAINTIRNAHYMNGVLQSPLYEAAGTNLCLQSENFGTTWLAVGAPTRVAASDTASGISLDLIGDDDAATLKWYRQTAIPFTGDGVKAFSLYVKKGTSTSSYLALKDTAGGTSFRIRGVLTWSGSVPAMTMFQGTFLGSESMTGGVYRLLFSSLTVTAANSHEIQIMPATDISTAVGGVGTLLVGGVQAEDTTVPTSYFKTTTATATRAADVDSLFSATANGYARTTGDFNAEGFGAGMEIRETGFSSNPITTITAVDPTGLTMTVRDARSVETALAGRRIYVGIPNDFAWENIKFTPTQGRPYVEEDYIPGPMSLDTLGPNGNLTCEPMYHLNIYVPQNSGIEADGGYADAILTLFAPSTEMVLTNGDKLFVRADMAPYQGQRQQVSGNSVIPITIPLRLFTNNSI